MESFPSHRKRRTHTEKQLVSLYVFCGCQRPQTVHGVGVELAKIRRIVVLDAGELVPSSDEARLRRVAVFAVVVHVVSASDSRNAIKSGDEIVRAFLGLSTAQRKLQHQKLLIRPI